MTDLLTLGTIIAPTILIIVHFRYAKSVSNIKQLIERISEETSSVEERLIADSQLERQKVEDLLHEIDGLRKEIENLQRENAKEFKLRTEIEKQIELALKDNEEAKKITNAILVTRKESEKTIKEAINELYEKLTNHDFEETEESEIEESEIEEEPEQIIVDKKEEYFEEEVEEEIDEEIEEQEIEEAETEETEDEEELEEETEDEDEFESEFDEDDELEEDDEKEPSADPESQIDKFLADLVDLIKVGGGKTNQNYFLAQDLETKNVESFECEIAFINEETLYSVDMKACFLFDEYNKASNKDQAEDALKENMTGYIDYICNPQYLEAILASLPQTAKYKNSVILLALESKNQIELFKELGFESKLQEAKIKLTSFKEINNLLL